MLANISAPQIVRAEGTLFVLDASGSMRSIAADGRSRFDHAKDQIRVQIDKMGPNATAGLLAFGHRTGTCDDIEMRVPPTSLSKAYFLNSLLSVSARGSTPLSKAIDQARTYVRDHGVKGVEVVVVSDGGDNCGGDAVQAARDFAAQTGCPLSVIGMDIPDALVAHMDAVARAGNGTFRREFTGTGPLAEPPVSKPGREGAPDDQLPIIDPDSVPKEISFNRAPAAQNPKPPAPPPQPKPAPPTPPLPPPAPKPAKPPKPPAIIMGSTPLLP